MCDFLEGPQIDELDSSEYEFVTELGGEYEEWLDWKETVDPEFETLKPHLPSTFDPNDDVPF